MTSQLNVDTIVDKAGSGGTNVKIANTSVTVAEGGSGTQNTVQGLAKGWLHYDQRTPTVRDSFNITSVEDTANGHYKATITNAMDNIYYTLAHSGSYDADITNSSRADIHFGFPETTTLYQNGSMNTGNSYIDDTYSLSVVHGDLA